MNGRKIGYVHQKNDASSIGNKRGMARRAKRNSSKRLRQLLRIYDEEEQQVCKKTR